MDPISLAITGAGVASDVFGALYNSRQAKDAAAISFDRQRILQNEMNVYNSPKEHMKRLAQAGLNPNLIYSGGYNPPASTASVGSQGVVPADFSQGVSIASQLYLQKRQLDLENKKLNLENKKLDLESRSLDSKINVDNADINLKDSQSRSIDFNTEYLKDTRDVNIDILHQQYDNLITEARLKDEQFANLVQQTRALTFDNGVKDDVRDDIIKSYEMQIRVLESQENNNNASASKSYADAVLTNELRPFLVSEKSWDAVTAKHVSRINEYNWKIISNSWYWDVAMKHQGVRELTAKANMAIKENDHKTFQLYMEDINAVIEGLRNGVKLVGDVKSGGKLGQADEVVTKMEEKVSESIDSKGRRKGNRTTTTTTTTKKGGKK